MTDNTIKKATIDMINKNDGEFVDMAQRHSKFLDCVHDTIIEFNKLVSIYDIKQEDCPVFLTLVDSYNSLINDMIAFQEQGNND